VDQLANALAKLTGETKTEAVTQALRERIQRVRRARAKRRLADELDEIALHCSTLPVRDTRSASWSSISTPHCRQYSMSFVFCSTTAHERGPGCSRCAKRTSDSMSGLTRPWPRKSKGWARTRV
jgi:antitoxin VapB